MADSLKSTPYKPKRLHALIFTLFLILIALGIVIGLSLNSTIVSETPAPVVNTTPVIHHPVMTGSLQINGETGYRVYLDGIYLGTLASPIQIFSNISSGIHDVTVEQFGVTGNMTVVIESEKTTIASIGLSKNQILVRMARVLGWDRKYPHYLGA